MDYTIERPARLRELGEINSPLRAALGAIYTGASLTPTHLTLHFDDKATRADRALAETTLQEAIGAIDVKQPPPSEKRRQRKEAHLASVATLNFADVKAQIDEITNIAQAKTVLTRMARILLEMASVLDLNDTELPNTGD